MSKTIQSTTDYDTFGRIGGNREVYPPHVKRLVSAFKDSEDSNSFSPIVVNEKMQVIDGQHRLAALAELGLPVYYIETEGLSLKDTQDVNSVMRPWAPIDFAVSYAELGYKPYQNYIEFKKKYHLNHNTLMRFLALDESATNESFRRGQFTTPNIKKSALLCEQLNDFVFMKQYRQRSFADAFLGLSQSPKYNHERFVQNLKSYYLEGKEIPHYQDTKDYHEHLAQFI